jgi:hypothetical protein
MLWCAINAIPIKKQQILDSIKIWSKVYTCLIRVIFKYSILLVRYCDYS